VPLFLCCYWNDPSSGIPYLWRFMSASEPFSFLSGCTSPPRSTFWSLLDLFLYVSVFFILSVVFNDFVTA
jgi:hypothetical protein